MSTTWEKLLQHDVDGKTLKAITVWQDPATPAGFIVQYENLEFMYQYDDPIFGLLSDTAYTLKKGNLAQYIVKFLETDPTPIYVRAGFNSFETSVICECGADKVYDGKLPAHSDWCAKYE